MAEYFSAFDSQDEKEKFEEIYIEYRQAMYAVAYNILGNRQDAEDAVHQAFVKIARDFKRVSSIPCRSLRTYIIVVCRNTSIDIYRKNKHYCEHTDIFSGESISDDEFEDENIDALKNAVKNLPEKYKNVVYLYYWRQLSTRDIAQALGISEDGVYKRVSRAKQMLFKMLKGDERNERK